MYAVSWMDNGKLVTEVITTWDKVVTHSRYSVATVSQLVPGLGWIE